MEERVDIILKQTITESITVDPALQSKIASFTDMVLEEARKTMAFGMAHERMALMKIVLGGAVRSAGKDFTSTENEARVGLEELLSGMRDDHGAPPQLTTVDAEPVEDE